MKEGKFEILSDFDIKHCQVIGANMKKKRRFKDHLLCNVLLSMAERHCVGGDRGICTETRLMMAIVALSMTRFGLSAAIDLISNRCESSRMIHRKRSLGINQILARFSKLNLKL